MEEANIIALAHPAAETIDLRFGQMRMDKSVTVIIGVDNVKSKAIRLNSAEILLV